MILLMIKLKRKAQPTHLLPDSWLWWVRPLICLRESTTWASQSTQCSKFHLKASASLISMLMSKLPSEERSSTRCRSKLKSLTQARSVILFSSLTKTFWRSSSRSWLSLLQSHSSLTKRLLKSASIFLNSLSICKRTTCLSLSSSMRLTCAKTTSSHLRTSTNLRESTRWRGWSSRSEKDTSTLSTLSVRSTTCKTIYLSMSHRSASLASQCTSLMKHQPCAQEEVPWRLLMLRMTTTPTICTTGSLLGVLVCSARRYMLKDMAKYRWEALTLTIPMVDFKSRC